MTANMSALSYAAPRRRRPMGCRIRGTRGAPFSSSGAGWRLKPDRKALRTRGRPRRSIRPPPVIVIRMSRGLAQTNYSSGRGPARARALVSLTAGHQAWCSAKSKRSSTSGKRSRSTGRQTERWRSSHPGRWGVLGLRPMSEMWVDVADHGRHQRSRGSGGDPVRLPKRPAYGIAESLRASGGV